jgi:hypothetical protein
MGTKYWFFTARHVHAVHAHAGHAHAVHGYVMHGHVMQATSRKPRHASHIMNGHVMHTNAVHWMLYVRINSDMPTVTIGQKPV